MNRQLLIVLISFMLFAFAQINGQITITASDIMNQNTIGSTQTFTADTTKPIVNVGKTGQQTWDFSSLTPSQNYVMTVVDPASTPFKSQFPQANIVFHYSMVYMGVQADAYMFNRIDNDYLNLGLYSTAEILPGSSIISKITDTPPSIAMKLPATLGTKWQQEYREIDSISMAGTPYRQTSERIITSSIVDAYGKAKMPDGRTIDVLRIRRDEAIYPNADTSGYSRSISYIFYSKNGDFLTVMAFDTLEAVKESFRADVVSWNQYAVTAVDDQKTAVKTFSLEQNYPNPFNPSTEIKYNIPQDSFIELKVYNSLGSEVALLENGFKPAGSYSIRFNAENLASGLYIARLRAGSYSSQIKMMLVK
ncbi:MAG: T9SS type A sorting domain-containing protein [Syntrophothermus sp.]